MGDGTEKRARKQGGPGVLAGEIAHRARAFSAALAPHAVNGLAGSDGFIAALRQGRLEADGQQLGDPRGLPPARLIIRRISALGEAQGIAEAQGYPDRGQWVVMADGSPARNT